MAVSGRVVLNPWKLGTVAGYLLVSSQVKARSPTADLQVNPLLVGEAGAVTQATGTTAREEGKPCFSPA